MSARNRRSFRTLRPTSLEAISSPFRSAATMRASISRREERWLERRRPVPPQRHATVQLDRLVAQGTSDDQLPRPEWRGRAGGRERSSAQQIRACSRTAYYSSLQPALAGYAASGSIVHYLDGQLLPKTLRRIPRPMASRTGSFARPSPLRPVSSIPAAICSTAMRFTSRRTGSRSSRAMSRRNSPRR